MGFKGWLLLGVFLLMQVGTMAASAFGPGAMGTAEAGLPCALAQCCCTETGDSTPACACLEDPAGNERPDPVMPASSSGGRDLLPSLVWVELRACARPMRMRSAPRASDYREWRATGRAAVPLALTVRYCAFLI